MLGGGEDGGSGRGESGRGELKGRAGGWGGQSGEKGLVPFVDD